MTRAKVVFAQSTLATVECILRAGDAWDANDPLVQARPDLFGPEPPEDCIRRTTAGPVEAPVEAGRSRRRRAK